MENPLKRKGALLSAPLLASASLLHSQQLFKLAMTAAMTAATARVTTASSTTTEVAAPAVTRCTMRATVTWHAASTTIARCTAIPTVATIRGAANDRLVHIQLRPRISTAVAARVAT